MHKQQVFDRYRELQSYVGWTQEHARRVHSLKPLVEPQFEVLIEDFYAEIERHPKAVQVITGGQAQIERLKGTLIQWLAQLFSGQYDADYAFQRWRVGYRHVEIGLDQVYTNAALSRLRSGLLQSLEDDWPESIRELMAARSALNTLLDLDLALIEDAYQTEYTFRQKSNERLVLIGQVAGGIAHELRNPLNVVRTSAFYLLNAKSPSPEKVREHLERIERQVGMAADVITSLTNFARMSTADRKPFRVLDEIRQVMSSTIPPENIEIVIDCSETLPDAVADASQIRIVLGNLVRNAIEAMPDGGMLCIHAEAVEPFVEVTVSDTGAGIPPEQLSRITEPFYSTKPRGIGLGLPMAKAIVEKNEGRIVAASTPGQGSRFTIRLRSHFQPFRQK
jgi:signal transduction histidine kinase